MRSCSALGFPKAEKLLHFKFIRTTKVVLMFDGKKDHILGVVWLYVPYVRLVNWLQAAGFSEVASAVASAGLVRPPDNISGKRCKVPSVI